MADMQAFRLLTVDARIHNISSLRRGMSSARGRLNNLFDQHNVKEVCIQMSEELIRNFEAKLAASACHPDADWDVLFIKLYEDISEVLPYLNAELEQPTDYRQSNRTLLWTYRDKKYAFRPHEIAIAPVCDAKEAQKLSNGIIETVNNIWKRKDEITPSFESRKPLPKGLDIYKLLPRSNCKKCGFPTCMAFALELRMDFVKLSLCPYLSEQDFKKLVSDHNVESARRD